MDYGQWKPRAWVIGWENSDGVHVRAFTGAHPCLRTYIGERGKPWTLAVFHGADNHEAMEQAEAYIAATRGTVCQGMGCPGCEPEEEASCDTLN